MSSHNRKQYAKRRLDDLICRFAQPLTQSRKPFWRLIHAVRALSRLLVPLPERGWTDPQDAERIVRACVRMANRCEAWQRQPERWTTPDTSLLLQFRSLVSHLFDEYPVPNFMAPVWSCMYDKPWELEMYLHLAAGRSIRQFELPLPYPTRITKRAAKFFMQAPDDAHPIGAYRWAQVRAIGGDNRLARLLMMSPSLCAPTEHEEFWESVIRFLIKNLPIAAKEISAIVWFIDQQRFRPAETVWGPGAGEQPLQPDFTIKGRSLMTLRRHMANWRTELLARRPSLVASTPGWERTNIRPFRHAEGDVLWTIDELLTDKELRVEGGIMKHCVATYIHDCARRRTSIWSMKVHEGERRKRTLTIEVRPRTRTIWQARGKRNGPPSEAAKEILHRWANQEGLKFRETA